MRCEDVHPFLADYLTGVAPAAVADHLRTCASCATEAAALRETWQRLGELPADRPDTPAMRSRFDALLAEHERRVSGVPRQVHAGPAGLRQTPVWRGRFVVQAGLAAAATLVLGVVLGRQTARPAAPDPQLAELRQELRDMRQMVTLSLMQQQSASERLKGVSWTGQIDQPGNEVVTALLDTLMHDPNVNVRLASVDALRRFASRDAVRRGAVDALPKQSSPMVQIALVDFLIEESGRESAATLRGLADDPMVDATVRARAQWGLQHVGM